MKLNQTLADFYLALLSIPADNVFRIRHQVLYAATRDAIAYQLMEDAEVVQRIFERMAQEDKITNLHDEKLYNVTWLNR